MKSFFTNSLLLICVLYASLACNNSLPINSRANTSKQVVSSYDIELLSSVYEGCIYTVRLAEEAIMRSTSVETKTFATSLLSDYKKIMENIEETAGTTTAGYEK